MNHFRVIGLMLIGLGLASISPTATSSPGQKSKPVECEPWEAASNTPVGSARYDTLERNYRTREVTFPSRASNVQLAGEITLPEGNNPRAGLILITGSGPQDRDETVQGRKPFLVLSDALTREGYAVLRYDDRGVAGSTGEYNAATVPSFAEDAAGAVDFLQTILRNGERPVGFIGHSEGGLVALQAARRSAVDFLVLMASPVAPFAEVIYEKTRGDLISDGKPPEVAENQAGALRHAIQIIAESDDPGAARSAASSALVASGLKEEAAHTYATAFTTPHWYWVAKHAPINDVRDFPGPILALYASNDAAINTQLMVETLEAAALSSVDYLIVDCVNHLFQRANASGSAAYSESGPVLDGGTIPALVEWLEVHGN